MSKKRISLRDEKGLVVESTIVDNFSIEKIPKDWKVKHNYSIWFEDEEQWDYE